MDRYFASVKDGYLCIYVGGFDRLDLKVWVDCHTLETLKVYFTNNRVEHITCSSSVDYPDENGVHYIESVRDMLGESLYFGVN